MERFVTVLSHLAFTRAKAKASVVHARTISAVAVHRAGLALVAWWCDEASFHTGATGARRRKANLAGEAHSLSITTRAVATARFFTDGSAVATRALSRRRAFRSKAQLLCSLRADSIASAGVLAEEVRRTAELSAERVTCLRADDTGFRFAAKA